MSTNTDNIRETARLASGRFGEQNLADPGTNVLTLAQRLPEQAGAKMPRIEPFNPEGKKRPLLFGSARDDVKRRLDANRQMLALRQQVAEEREQAMEDARMVMLANSSTDGGLSRALFETSIERHLTAQIVVQSGQALVDEGEWRLGIAKKRVVAA